ncbi:ABC transporter permease [Cohnella sp. CFH 77786]|uniref:ABC transporter permease n=1 Tax=Cohnella sp. CFH 77786 TaxID=2662265 RepID=UPI001C608641|nr:ABC transporter permease [Cohnella sp. CFH 77786]MBW5445539.1 ABC transporter permease [Cohnella sp. CFH 77786]
MNKLGTVIAFTMRNKMRSKAFLISTLVLILLVVIGGNVPYLINKFGGDKTRSVGYVEGQYPEIVQGLRTLYAKQEKPDVKLENGASDEKQLKAWVEDGTISGYLTFTDNPAIGFPSAIYHSKSALGSDTSQSLQIALQEIKNDFVLKDAKLSDEQKSRLNAPIAFQNEQVTDGSGKTAEEQGTAIGLTYVIVILLFMSVMISGQLIATEITAEKSSRVMEIIVTSVSPLAQMFGKVIGTFVVAILQIAGIVGALVINLNLPHNADALQGFGIRLDTVDPAMIVYTVVFFLTGFFLYAMMFAAVGSIVSRTEDLGQAVLPITMLTIVGFYVAMFGLTHPDSPLIVVCSFIPFFSPFLMVLRVGLAEPGWWEIALSIGILLVSILVLGWLSAKIYRTGVLMYGKRPSVKELVKAMKAYKV